MSTETEYDGAHFDGLIATFQEYEAWGIHPTVSDDHQNAVTLARQTGFLAHFSECGTILKASQAASVHRSTIYDWMQNDKFGFNLRMQAARGNFLERLEDIAFHRILHPDGRNRTGGDVLVITMLNAHAPEKYRTGIVVVDETPKAVAAKLAKLAQEDKEERDQAPAATRADNITMIERMREGAKGGENAEQAIGEQTR